MHLHVTAARPFSRSAAEPLVRKRAAVAQLAAGGKKGGKAKAASAAVGIATAPAPHNPNPTTLGWDGPASVTVWDQQGHHSHGGVVGRRAWVDINPQYPLAGHETTSTEQTTFYDFLANEYNLTFIRGHLVNADVGGSNIAENLFPITSTANGEHKNYVENHIKGWLRDQASWRIHYEVAAQQGANVVEGARFYCKASRFTHGAAKPDKKIDRTIYSYPKPPPKTAGGFTQNDQQPLKFPGIKKVWAWIASSAWAHQPGLSKTDLAQIAALLTVGGGGAKKVSANPKKQAAGAKKGGAKIPTKKPKPRLFRSTKVPAGLASAFNYFAQ